MGEFGIKISETFGDTLYATPVIAYMSRCHNKKFHIETMFPDLFKNNPYVEKIYNTKNGEYFPEDIIVYEVKRIFEGDMFRQRKMHSIDFYSSNLGFILSPDEKTLLYYPDELDIDLPSGRYVVINPSVTTICRTWDKDKWEALIDMIIATDTKVVVVGKEINYEHEFNRGVMSVGGNKVIDLINKLNTSQLWHIIENSLAIFTMNAGLWPFAGTTDANIIAMGSTINPHYRAPYRYGSQDYKHYFVGGECKIFCHTDMKYNSSGNIKVTGGFPVASCFENKPTYECQPTPENVFKIFLNLLENQKQL
jgi:ADP-heptose:LPS heptosyltransferase